MHQVRLGLAVALFASVPLVHAGDGDASNPVIYGQVRLVGPSAIPVAWRLTLREVDSGKLERLQLSQREATGEHYDFAQRLPAGRYFFYSLVSPKSNADYRIADAKNYFEVKEGATVYLGTWTIRPGLPSTTYTVDYDMAEVGLFASANPARDTAKFAVGVLGKPAVPLKTQ